MRVTIECEECCETRDIEVKPKNDIEGEEVTLIFKVPRGWFAEPEGYQFLCPDCKKEYFND